MLLLLLYLEIVVVAPLALCVVVAGKLECLCDPQSCAGGSLVLLAVSTMVDWSAGEGSDKTSTLALQAGGWAWGEHSHSVKTLICN